MATSQVATRPHLDYHRGYPPMSTLVERVAVNGDANNGETITRQPSQQDLEIARQLQNFHEQNSLPIREDDEPQPADHSSPEVNQPASHETTTQPHQRTSPAASDFSELANPAMTGQVCTNCGTTKTPLWRRSPAGAVICNACGLYYKARNQMRPVGLKRTAGPLISNTTSQTADRSTSPTPLQSGANYVSTDQVADGTCPGGGRCNSQGGQLICQGCPSFNNRIAKAAQVALRQAGDRAAEPSSTHQSPHSSPQTVVVACQNCGTTVTPLWRRDEAGNAICNACGLYHKLHGHHRPVQMKKAEIKRRKRVVPANVTQDGSAAAYPEHVSDVTSSHVASASPNTQHQHITVLEPRTGPTAIPVDYTDTFRRPAYHTDLKSNPNKRPYSATTTTTTTTTTSPESEPYPHPQNMGFSAINAIDPSLPSRDGGGGQASKEARRAELRREADKMRQLLEEKERELAALTDDA